MTKEELILNLDTYARLTTEYKYSSSGFLKADIENIINTIFEEMNKVEEISDYYSQGF